MVSCLDDILRVIKKLGFSKNVYGETISLSFKGSNIGSIMPLGILFDNKLFYARIYKDTSMYVSIVDLNYNSISINVCSDPILFYYAIFDKRVLLDNIVFSNGDPYIKQCNAYIIARVVEIQNYRDYIMVYMDPMNLVIIDNYPKVYNRASFAIIEALIYYTKLGYVDKDLADKYIEMIRFFVNIVYHSSSICIYRKIIKDILDRSIEKYKRIYS